MEHTPITTILTLSLLTTPALAVGHSTSSTDEQLVAWVPVGNLVPESPIGEVGGEVAVDGPTAIVTVQDHVEVFERTQSVWRPMATLSPAAAIGSIALDGDTAILGSPGSEVAYVYEQNAGSWAQVAALNPPGDLEEGSSFGWSVAVDGATVAVAALGGASPSVSIFQVSDGVASTEAVLSSPNSDDGEGDWFGWDLDLDEGVLVVSELKDQTAHVYEASSAGWAHAATLSGDSPFSRFGRTVAIDGDHVAVGASGSGTVHVFAASTGEWTRQAVLSGDDLDLTPGSGQFAWSVDLDGSTLVVGSPEDGPTPPPPGMVPVSAPVQSPCQGIGVANTCDRSGAAYVFEKFDETGWEQTAKLVPPWGLPSDEFGTGVAIDADTVLAGAPDRAERAMGAPPGSVYAFSSVPGGQ